jgi:WD40 repeat protein
VAVLAGADAAAVRRGLDTAPEWFALTARQAALARPSRLAGDSDSRAAEQYRLPRQRRVVLVVDQFEELFTQCAEEGQRRAFITALHAAATAGHGPDRTSAALVVLGVRADFEARCAGYPELADAVQDRYLVTAMTERQLRMAITEPAKKTGSNVDDDLTEVLLAEVRTRQSGTFGAGMLPLLSHALDQAWRSRAGHVLTLADYERTGGIDGAVAASAQRAYDTLTPAQQGAARQVFLRLTATSPEGMDSAGRATRAELTDGKSAAEAQDVEAVLEAFAAERLFTLAAGTVELSHEALLSAWSLLRDTWLADTHADRIVRSRLHTTAAEWERHSHDPSYLYGGTLLQAAAGTAARIGANPTRYPPLSQTERDFLHASDRARRRSVRRRQSLVALLAALAIGLAAATGLAVRAGQQVTQQRNIALAGLLISESRSVASNYPALSRLLSVAAWRINPSNASRHAMLAAAALPIAILTGHTGAVCSVAFSPDGKILATGNSDGTVRLWNMATHRQITTLTGHAGEVLSVAFSPDGKTLATGNSDGTVRLWNLATHHPIGAPLHAGHIPKMTWRPISAPLTGHDSRPVSVTFSPDSKLLATGVLSVTFSPDSKLLATGVLSVTFSPDGKLLATGGGDGTVRLWDVATHRPIGGPLTSYTGAVSSVAFSADGKTLATGNSDGTVRLWDTATGRQIGSLLTGHHRPVTSVAFSPDGKTLATGNSDGTVRLWDAATHRQIGKPLKGYVASVTSLAFSPDGKTLASGSLDGTVRLWNMATQGQNAAKQGDLVPYLCALAGRSLTRTEWARYVPQGLAYQRVCP